MTRFARAKGSKASNERQPNEPTPWHVMKADLKKDHGTKMNEKPKSVSDLLKEKEEPYYHDTTGNVNHGWSEFETIETNKKKDNDKKNVQNKRPESVAMKKCEKMQKSDKNNDTLHDNNVNKLENESHLQSTTSTANKKTIKKKKTELAVSKNSDKGPKIVKTESKDIQVQEVKDGVRTVPLSKRQKRNRKRAKNDTSVGTMANDERTTPGNTNFNIEGNSWNTDVKFGKKPKLGKDTNKNNNSNEPYNTQGIESKKIAPPIHPNPNAEQASKRKAPKVRDNNVHKRRKPDVGGTTITVNGKDIDIVKYDGFPIMKEDAERLKKLKEEMAKKGIPYSEINRALKLERRRCEKVLARQKKNVCFHCRLSGHQLSECPNLDKEESAIGICFKCGSTEHTHFECKVNKTQEFRYATCFICREEGHIAKQCPDNPKGLYPQGGACKICGDVTHLKKDCPDLMKEKDENTITLDTIASEDIESLDKDSSHASKDSKTLKQIAKSKIINF